MPTNVNTAFNKFFDEIVNLATEDSRSARTDRDNLRSRIQGLQSQVAYFPALYTEADINFGSFARKT
ncbi:hypothetical protein KIN13_03090, partial [Vibrio cholerae]